MLSLGLLFWGNLWSLWADLGPIGYFEGLGLTLEVHGVTYNIATLQTKLMIPC